MFVGDLAAEFLVVGLVIVPPDALLGHAGRAAGFKNVERPALVFRWHPDFRLQVAQGLVLEVRKPADKVGEGIHFLAWVEILPGPIEPERAAAFRREMPRDDFANVGVEPLLGGLDIGFGDRHRDSESFTSSANRDCGEFQRGLSDTPSRPRAHLPAWRRVPDNETSRRSYSATGAWD